MRYVYLGDRLTERRLRGALCDPVLNARGKCIRGRNGSMLVEFAEGERHIVIARRLRLSEGAKREQEAQQPRLNF